MQKIAEFSESSASLLSKFLIGLSVAYIRSSNMNTEF